IDALSAAGAIIRIGQSPDNLDGVDTVVATTGVRPDNVELVEAMRRGLRIIHRATALAALMVGRTAVLVAGTHGKTTTTSMLAVALETLGSDPSYAIGGEIGASGISGHAGGGDVFVAEADESDGTFRHYQPDVAVVTNVELDHTDYFGSLDDVHKAFVEFVDRLKPAAYWWPARTIRVLSRSAGWRRTAACASSGMARRPLSRGTRVISGLITGLPAWNWSVRQPASKSTPKTAVRYTASRLRSRAATTPPTPPQHSPSLTHSART